jgi:hypothetical protein
MKVKPETTLEIALETELKAVGQRFTDVQKSWSQEHQLMVFKRMHKARLRDMLHRLAQESRDRNNPEFNRVPLGGYAGSPLVFGNGTGGGERVIRSVRGLGG